MGHFAPDPSSSQTRTPTRTRTNQHSHKIAFSQYSMTNLTNRKIRTEPLWRRRASHLCDRCQFPQPSEGRSAGRYALPRELFRAGKSNPATGFDVSSLTGSERNAQKQKRTKERGEKDKRFVRKKRKREEREEKNSGGYRCRPGSRDLMVASREMSWISCVCRARM